MEYSKKDDWGINKSVSERLVRAWIDTQKLRISTTKGNVEITGELVFTGQMKANIDSAMMVMNMLKKIDTALKAIPKVRLIKYSLSGWRKTGMKWEYRPTRDQEEKDDYTT